jgi:hypothetical protein
LIVLQCFISSIQLLSGKPIKIELRKRHAKSKKKAVLKVSIKTFENVAQHAEQLQFIGESLVLKSNEDLNLLRSLARMDRLSLLVNQATWFYLGKSLLTAFLGSMEFKFYGY